MKFGLAEPYFRLLSGTIGHATLEIPVRKLNSLLFAALLACVVTTNAQSVSDVLMAFRKLEANTESGMNYGDYARGLTEVNAQLKTFGDMNRGKPPAAIDALRSAFVSYNKARTLWDEQRLQDLRYQSGEISLTAYFDAKSANTTEIAGLWTQAGLEVDRAAALLNPKRESKRK
jgi:hypothetical protein